MNYLSGLKLIPYTGPLCPYKILDSLAVFSSMILSRTSSDSLSIKLKSTEGYNRSSKCLLTSLMVYN